MKVHADTLVMKSALFLENYDPGKANHIAVFERTSSSLDETGEEYEFSH